jgi:AcrR family transcriptional regulator
MPSVSAQADPPKSTRERILDAAERLFAEHGFDAVGMRALAEEAEVNLGAATYHFGSKEALYSEVFLRRFKPTEDLRVKMLKKAQAEHDGPLEVKKIVECMIRPPFFTVLEHPDFAKLLARNLFLPPPFMKGVIEKEVEITGEHFLAAFTKSMPNVPPGLILMRMMLSGGVLLMFAANMSGAKILAKAGEAVLGQLVDFIAAGMEAPGMMPFTFPKPPFPLPKFAEQLFTSFPPKV